MDREQRGHEQRTPCRAGHPPKHEEEQHRDAEVREPLRRCRPDGLPPARGNPVRFTEFDPREEVDGSVADTSWVARRLAAERDDDFDAAATRVWTIMEALRKAGSLAGHLGLGLGNRLTSYSSMIQMPQFFAVVLILSFLGILIYVLFFLLGKKYASWEA